MGVPLVSKKGGANARSWLVHGRILVRRYARDSTHLLFSVYESDGLLRAAQNTTCCTSQPSSSEVTLGRSCFAALANVSSERCVDPMIFLDASDTRRCTSSVDCGHGRLCVRPRGDQELVVLTMHLPPWLRTNSGEGDKELERKLVWQGDRSEILHEGLLSASTPVYFGANCY